MPRKKPKKSEPVIVEVPESGPVENSPVVETRPLMDLDEFLSATAEKFEANDAYRRQLKRMSGNQAKLKRLKVAMMEILECTGLLNNFKQKVEFRKLALKGKGGDDQTAFYDVASVFLPALGIKAKLMEARILSGSLVEMNPGATGKSIALPAWAVSIPDPAKLKEIEERKARGESVTVEDVAKAVEESGVSAADVNLRDNLAMGDVAEIDVPDVRMHMHWVYENLDRSETVKAQAPSDGCWAMLIEARNDRAKFFDRYWTFFARSSEEAQKARMLDDGRQTIELIGQIKDARRQSMEASEYAKAQAEKAGRERAAAEMENVTVY